MEAIDILWSSVLALGPLKVASAWMSVINFETSAEEAEKNPKFRQIFEVMGKDIDPAEFSNIKAANERPFVSPLAWALYSAYAAAIMSAVARLKMLELGVGDKDFINTKNVDALLKAALPHQADYISKYGSGGYHHLLDELENTLLAELKRLLAGAESDEESVKQSASILRATEQVNLDMELKAEIPDSVRSEPPPAPE